MSLENATYINDLVASNPPGGDSKSEGDNHLRMVKSVLQNTFPGLAGRLERVQGKTASYNLAVTDNLSTILFFGGTNPLLSTAVSEATLGNGFTVNVVNISGSTVTFDPSGGAGVNGVLNGTSVLPNLSGGFLWCDGANWYSIVVPLTPGAFVPTGVVNPYAGFSAPIGWLMCDGAAHLRTDYPGLFATIGGQYGAPDALRFNVPNISGRTIFGREPFSQFLTPGVSGMNSTVLGFVGGTEHAHAHNHTGQSDDDSPDHAHFYSHAISLGVPAVVGAGGAYFHAEDTQGTTGATTRHRHTFTTGVTFAGGSQNIPPAIIMNFIIKT